MRSINYRCSSIVEELKSGEILIKDIRNYPWKTEAILNLIGYTDQISTSIIHLAIQQKCDSSVISALVEKCNEPICGNICDLAIKQRYSDEILKELEEYTKKYFQIRQATFNSLI